MSVLGEVTVSDEETVIGLFTLLGHFEIMFVDHCLNHVTKLNINILLASRNEKVTLPQNSVKLTVSGNFS